MAILLFSVALLSLARPLTGVIRVPARQGGDRLGNGCLFDWWGYDEFLYTHGSAHEEKALRAIDDCLIESS